MAELRAVMSDWESSNRQSSPSYQHWLFYCGLGGMSLAWIGTVVAGGGSRPPWLVYLSLLSLLVGTLAVVVASVANAAGFLREWRMLEAEVLDEASKRMEPSYEAICKIFSWISIVSTGCLRLLRACWTSVRRRSWAQRALTITDW